MHALLTMQPTHHHHDHTYGINDYIALGAKLIVPEVTADFWKSLPDAEVITYR